MEERTQHRTNAPGRLRFALGEQSVDVAVPVEVPLGDLLPAVMAQFGGDTIEQGAEHEGWVVQRLGEPPLDEDRTSSELNLMDGETLYLRPRAAQLAPIDYDDLVDGVGEQIRNHPNAWAPERTRWMLQLGSGAALLIGLVLLVTGGEPGLRAAVAGATAVLLLAGAAVAARAIVKPVAATVLAGAAAGYAAVATGVGVGALAPLASWQVEWAAGAVGALLALAAGVAVVADSALLFAGALTAVLLLTVPLVIGATTTLASSHAAAIGIAVTLIAGLFIPGVAFRLSGLTLPMLPTNADELKEDTDPVPYQVVVDRGKVTMGYLTALQIGAGLAQSVLFVLFLPATGLLASILNAVVSLLMFMRAKHIAGAVTRWAVLVPAAVGVLTLVLRLGMAEEEVTFRLLWLWFPVIVVAVALLLLSERLPGNRLRPYWGRAADIFESLTAVSVLPLLLGVLNVYSYIRGVIG
ncbi:type VII secretion integral membrane protein EccD [Amycolatopsis pithecellobii]|uniref:Type VII secretion integral membrane protein EccD n=1 Tax=Amycolatopsis pithecellobii TaxID=664692 RepID=A0A6N7Z4R9_9PSEU|nr:type VII secretion integral membrane protein EccD [Amycolatopsis pithecellobii]MTD55404.1 type VII secretion integral membrane protein EccD [Amycolatopsis pithecellobii]